MHPDLMKSRILSYKQQPGYIFEMTSLLINIYVNCKKIHDMNLFTCLKSKLRYFPTYSFKHGQKACPNAHKALYLAETIFPSSPAYRAKHFQ